MDYLKVRSKEDLTKLIEVLLTDPNNMPIKIDDMISESTTIDGIKTGLHLGYEVKWKVNFDNDFNYCPCCGRDIEVIEAERKLEEMEEIIYCKDCKHHSKDYRKYCDLLGLAFSDDDYCSCGEAKEEVSK